MYKLSPQKKTKKLYSSCSFLVLPDLQCLTQHFYDQTMHFIWEATKCNLLLLFFELVKCTVPLLSYM